MGVSRYIDEGRGHEVTTVARGQSGVFPDGVTPIFLDRESSNLDEKTLPGTWDAAIDVARQPGWVRNAVEHLKSRARHFVFISSISVYAHSAAYSGLDESAELLPPLESERMKGLEFYGNAKVRSEMYAQQFPGEVSILRPGLIGGPGDTTGRSGYWPWRFDRPGPALVPEEQDGPMQLTDVRDLAQFTLDIAAGDGADFVDVTGTDTSTAELLNLSGGAEADTIAAETPWLTEHGVIPWMGPNSMPLWLPNSDHWSMFAHTGAKARELGYQARPLSETLMDSAPTFAVSAAARKFASGLSDREQTELLADVGAQSGPQ